MLGMLLFSTPARASDTEQCLQLYYMKSYTRALPFCTASAATGNDQSQYVLGLMYSNGLGVKKNKPAAIKWLQAAAEQSHAAAHYKLDQLKNDYAVPIQQLLDNQEHTASASLTRGRQPDSHTTAQSQPASTHTANTEPDINMTGTTAISSPDDQELYQHYLAAANKGDAHARFILGLLYLEGRGVQQNPRQAGKWITMAAQQGLAKAQLSTGLLYYHGYAGSAPEPKTAMYWFTKAAEQGLPEAQYSLGLIYANGSAGEKNEIEALKWWQKAAAQDYAKAQHNLALLYLNGIGVQADRHTSMQWFIREAKHNDPQAQFNLGRLYSEGKWFDQSGLDAASWFYRAGETWLNRHQPDKARQAAEKIKQLVKQQHLTVPNLFLADVLSQKIEEPSGSEN